MTKPSPSPTGDNRGVTAANGTTKARIERSALILFCQRGVDAVTTREIAQASAISEGALYRHFPGKEALAETMFFAIHKRLADAISAATGEAETIEDKARAIVAAYCTLADEDWSLFSYHLLTTHRFLPFAERPQHNGPNPVSLVEKMIADAMKRGEAANGDPALIAAAVLGIVMQSALHKLYGRVKGDMSDHQTALTHGVIAVLKS